MAVVRFQLRVYILGPVAVVLVILESFAVGDIGALKLDNYLVWALLLHFVRNVDFVVDEDIWGIMCDEGSIDRERLDPLSPVINEEAFVVFLSLDEVLAFLCQSEQDLNPSVERFSPFRQANRDEV